MNNNENDEPHTYKTYTHKPGHACNLYRSSLKSNAGTNGMKKTQKSGGRGIGGWFCGSRNIKRHCLLHDSQAQLRNNASLLYYLAAWLIELLCIGSNVSHIKLSWCHTAIKVILKSTLEGGEKKDQFSNDLTQKWVLKFLVYLDTCEAKTGADAMVKCKMQAHGSHVQWVLQVMLPSACSFIVDFSCHCLTLYVSAYMAIFKCVGYFYIFIFLKESALLVFAFFCTWSRQHNLQNPLNNTVQQDAEI
jgi:hypothetical protein